MLFNVFPDKLQSNFAPIMGNVEGNVVVAAILLLSAAISLPMSNVVSSFGVRRSYWSGLIVVMISVVAIVFLNASSIVLLSTLIFVIGFTTMSVSALPFVLRESSFAEKVFCVGVFYSAVALPDGIVETILAYLPSIGM